MRREGRMDRQRGQPEREGEEETTGLSPTVFNSLGGPAEYVVDNELSSNFTL